jgi:pimeloyl-ACP methyl ester carboxylesterase
MVSVIQLTIGLMGLIYQTIACRLEQRQLPPGQFVTVNGVNLHQLVQGKFTNNQPTIVLDHSLGGVEGYFLLDHLTPLGQVWIYDRAGYGWSDRSPRRRTSQAIVEELDTALTQAGIAPPYLLIGDSFGSYNVRLYAHTFPEKVCGLVLTDGLHESGMLTMPLPLRGLQALFIAGFGMAIVGASLGIVRFLRALGVFQLLKPELRTFERSAFNAASRSFCRPKHWITMCQELFWLDQSGREVAQAKDLGDLPIVDIKSASFFRPALWTKIMPLGQANQLRDRMHEKLMQLSTNTHQIEATKSGHFVWIDQPEMIVEGVAWVMAQIDSNSKFKGHLTGNGGLIAHPHPEMKFPG